MDKLEFALETIDGGTFEALAADFLRVQDYDVHESGRTGADGGWDARIELGGRNGIVHTSTQTRWKRKLRKDAKKVKKTGEQTREELRPVRVRHQSGGHRTTGDRYRGRDPGQLRVETTAVSP